MTRYYRYASACLRVSSLASAFASLPFGYYVEVGTGFSLILLGALGLLFDRWLSMRYAIAELKGRSAEAVQLSRAIASRYARHTEEALETRQREEKFRSAFENAAIGMAMVSASGQILKVNNALAHLIGFTDEQLKGTDFEALLPDYEKPAYNREITKIFYRAVGSIRIEQRLLRSNGETVWVIWTASLIPTAEGDTAKYIFQFQDISERKRAERTLAYDAVHDRLTGLPNRVLFLERLQTAFRNAQRRVGAHFAVCYLDFDRFKLVNDSFSHTVGDQLLIEMAARLRSVVPGGETLARLGGDEFAILIDEIEDIETAISRCEIIRNEMARPFDLDECHVQSTVSIGIAPWSPDYDRPELLLRDADTALSHAKLRGRDRYEVFCPEMRENAVRFLESEADLRAAIELNEFSVFYQPIFDLETSEIAGFEALIRWDHPRRGQVLPGEFIPIAEETGMIFPIGEWVLRDACRQMATWHSEIPGSRRLWIAVNVSAKQFMQPNLQDLVSEVLAETGLRASSLKLEITETAMAENLSHVADVMARLKKIGVRLSIDDFGTGYSSLNSIHLLPLDSLKIDRSFVNHMASTIENHEIIKTIISLAGSLNLEVIAEGVETADQVAQLKDLG